MKPSDFDGKRVVYVDAAQVQHTGSVIGQTDDEAWILVQSDRYRSEAGEWHFRVAPEMMPGILAG